MMIEFLIGILGYHNMFITFVKKNIMAELLIAEFKNKHEAELVAQLIGTMHKAKVLQKGKTIT